MKKNFYSVCTFAFLTLMASASASAQEPVKAQRPTKALHATKAQRAVGAPQAVSYQEIEAQSNDLKVPISVSCNNGSGQAVQSKAEYDQKGRVCRITSDDGTVYQMTYAENAQGNWTTKTTSVSDGKEELHRLKTERTFDDKGRITAIEDASYDFDSKRWTPTHSYAYDYDMSHLAKDPEATRQGDAILIKDITYKVTANGIPYSEGFEYVWFEPEQCYSVLEPCLGYRAEIKLDGNTLSYCNIYYDEETGEITYDRYTKEEVQEDTPQPGYYTIIEYNSWDNKNWEISSKNVITKNFYAPFTPDDKQKRERSEYFFNEETQQYFLSANYVMEWVDHPTLKMAKVFVHNEGLSIPDYYEYELINELGRTETSIGYGIALSDNGDYSITQGYSPLQIITFYSAQGEKKRQVRITGTSTTLAQAPCIAEERKDGEWVPLRNATLKSGDTGETILSFTTNEDGYITSQTTYNNSSYEKESISECTYSDMGYTSEEYGKEDESEQKYLKQRDVCTKISEDAFEIISTEYEKDGTVASKERKVCQDGVTFTYSWDNETNQWSDQYRSVAPIITMEDDGTKTTIYRTYTDGEVVNDSKKVEKPYRIPVIKIMVPTNPMPDVIPADFFRNISSPLSGKRTSTTRYEWNTETNQWDLSSESSNDYWKTKDEATGITTYHVKSSGDMYVYSVDSEGRLAGYQDYDRHLAYSYDEDGKIIQVSSSTEAGKEDTYIITYGKTGITDGISLTTATQALSLHVDGRTITLADAGNHAQGNKSLQLYSLDGKLVGKSQAGSVTAPAAGTYVVVADGVKAKISVK